MLVIYQQPNFKKKQSISYIVIRKAYVNNLFYFVWKKKTHKNITQTNAS